MTLRIAIPDLISPSYFPAIAAVELGVCAASGIDAEIELVYPVTDAFARLRDGSLDYVAGAAHAVLGAFPGWTGSALLGAISQHMYWFLVVRSGAGVGRGDLAGLAGMRIGAAPGPIDGLRLMLDDAGLDPDADVTIGPVPGAEGAGVSFGVTAAKALEAGTVDAFWANGMGAEVAVRSGTGTVVVDARRGDGPPGTRGHTFAGLVTTAARLARCGDEVAAVTAALATAQRRLRDDPSLAVAAASPHFGPAELDLITTLVGRDAPFYEPVITPDAFGSMCDSARRLGLLDRDGPCQPFDAVVPALAREVWAREVRAR